MDQVASRILKLEKAIDEAVRQASPEIRAVIEAQALRGGAQTTAATIVSELGSVSRFQSPRQRMGYSGLVAREHVTARGRELLGFLWAIAVHTEGQPKQLSKIA